MPAAATVKTRPLPAGLIKLGLLRPIDRVLHFPLRYEDESQVVSLGAVLPGQTVQCQVTVLSAQVVFKPRRMLVVLVQGDLTQASLRFIYFNESLRQRFVPGEQLRFIGQARRAPNGLEFIHPKIRWGWLEPDQPVSPTLVSIYPTTQGLTQPVIARHIAQALASAMPAEWLDQQTLQTLGLPDLPRAIETLHRPPIHAHGPAELEPCWRRIRLDELVAQQIALRRARARRAVRQAPALVDQQGLCDRLLAGLPFQLTGAQQRAWQQVSQDLAQSRPAHRLIQGDVGSGKTVVAVLAAAQAVGAGWQAALMAPTEILAQQLFQKTSEWLSPLGVSVLLLKGGMPAAARREALSQISEGQAQVVVGTHALIQKSVNFHRLGLALVDEQHRFGVGQRLALRETVDGLVSHTIGMSATPIPRSLAMTFLADLDVSVIDERPPGRTPIRTRLMAMAKREELAQRLLHYIDTQDGQAYWVCPVIEEQQDAERALLALEETQAWLAPLLGERLGVVHGRMPAKDKQAVMARFASGELRVLLATTVIEVGVDVPQARLMVIDHAERFGLAQLHQLRGRVGRGAGQSSCILLFDEPLSEAARQRLKALYETDDGFELANRDLAQRGPGELLGMRQSGEPSLRFSDLTRDQDLVAFAVDYGQRLIAAWSDPVARKAMGVSMDQLHALLDRWAHQADDLLTST
ncbi:MAG: ATP-dependent DNA helicase RecG [Burkholderiaceae bacterium]